MAKLNRTTYVRLTESQALNDYFGLIEKIARGLRQEGVAKVGGLGTIFTNHLENHKGYTKVGDPVFSMYPHIILTYLPSVVADRRRQDYQRNQIPG